MKEKSGFVHLHIHSEYSLLDGSCRIDGLIKKAKELNMPAIAITDHGVMYGVIDFYKKAREAGVKPIIGCELYVAPRSRHQKVSKSEDALNYHIVLLAKDIEGYENLLELVSKAHLEGFYYKPRVDKELLRKHSKGIIALSACLHGEIAAQILNNKMDEAENALKEYIDIFGKDNFYLELMDHNLAEQKHVNLKLIELSEKAGIPVVATNDCHYLNKTDSLAHDVQLCIQTGKTFSDSKRLAFETEEFYLKSEEEMKIMFLDIPEAISNSVLIADRCNVEIDLSTIHLPHFPLPDNKNTEEYLEELCIESLKRRFPEAMKERGEKLAILEERMRYELSVIKEMGFSAYFLIIWDFISFAKKCDIPVGPGRGSAAGSIVAYLLGITDVDPLKFSLLFERFLNPGRKSMPDIDTDFCVERREEVIKYVKEKYGMDHVSQIVTFGKMKARAAIRDVGRVLTIPLAFVDKIAKLIPFNNTIEKSLETEDLKQLYDSDETVRQLIDTAKVVEGLARNASIHAAGVVISKNPLSTYVPLQKMNGEEIVSQYDMNAVSDIGLLKMDFLGLRNLTVIHKCLNMIKKNHSIEIDMANLPFDDINTYKLLQEAKTTGVFQVESSGMQGYLRQLKPDRFEDIVALVALYRPGPLEGGVVDDFIKRRHGRMKVVYLHPLLEPILKETYGVIVYQEQVMQIANFMAGYSMGQADDLRKAMGKKKPEVMAKHQETFINGCKNNKIDTKVAKTVWDFVEKFAGYGFNKCHTVPYAMITYQTAYLKANYPLEYMACLLTSHMDKIDKVSFNIKECRNMGIAILPPDINESEVEFSVSQNVIRFGLAAIKNVGRSAIESIITSRKKVGSFKSLNNFLNEVDLKIFNKKIMESLIKSGAMDCFGETKATLLANLDYMMDYGQKAEKERRSGQISLFEMNDSEDGSFSDFELPHKAPEFEKSTILNFEKEMLGLFISDHPLNSVKDILRNKVSGDLHNLNRLSNGDKVVCAGVIQSIKRIATKKNLTMAFLVLEDLSDSCEVVVLPNVYDKGKDYLCEDAIVIIEGKVELKEKGDSSGEGEEELPALEAKLIAEEVYPIDAIDAVKTIKGRKVNLCGCHILVNSSRKEHLKSLSAIIEKSKGETSLFLHLESPGGKTIIELNENMRISHTEEFKEDVEKLLGTGSIWNQ